MTSYPLARSLYISPAESVLQRTEAREFVGFSLSHSTVDRIATAVGYVPASDEQSLGNPDTLEGIVGE